MKTFDNLSFSVKLFWGTKRPVNTVIQPTQRGLKLSTTTVFSVTTVFFWRNVSPSRHVTSKWDHQRCGVRKREIVRERVFHGAAFDKLIKRDKGSVPPNVNRNHWKHGMFQRAEVQKYVAKFGSGGNNFGIVVVDDGVPLEGAMQGQSKNGEGNGSYY